MTDLRRLSLPALIARFLFLAALPFVFDTCELVNAPGEVGGAIEVRLAGGIATMVVGRNVSPLVNVTQGGAAVADPRLQFFSSDISTVAVDGSVLKPLKRGQVTISVRLVGSTVGQNAPGDSVGVRVIAAGIRADLSALTVPSINDTVTLVAHALNEAGDNIPAQVGWISSIPSVATIDTLTGKLRALSNGTALMIAEVDGRKDTVTADVRQQLVRYEFTPTAVLFSSLGDTLTIAAIPKDRGGTTVAPSVAPPRTLQSTFPNRVTVTPAGKITSVDNGVAGIEVRSGTVADTLRVEVRQVAQRVVITGPDSVLIEAIGDTTKLIALATDQLTGGILNAEPVWVSLDPQLAIVAPLSGVVRALVVGGPARIVARLDNGADTVRVYITNLPRILDVTPANVLITAVGDATQLAGTPRNRLGAILTSIPGGVSWSHTDATVATVDNNGLVTGTGIGTGRVVATALGGTLADTAEIVVINSPDSVAIIPTAITLESVLDEVTPAADIRNSRGATLNRSAVTWVSRDPGIATVSPLGVIRAAGRGTAYVVATNPNNAARTDSVQITVTNAPVSLTLNRTTDTLTAPTKTLAYQAVIRNARGDVVTDLTPSWLSTNTAVATVTGAGLLTAVAIGRDSVIVSVTGTQGTRADTAVVVVQNVPRILLVSPTTAQLTSLGGTQQLAATALNDLGFSIGGLTFLWTSTNSGVAAVDATGVVTAQAVGGATILVTVAGLQASTAISVTNSPDTLDITPTTATLASVHDSVTPAVRFVNGLGALLPRTGALWTTDDAAVAQVTSAGIVIATGRGVTKVRSTSPTNSSRTDSITVTVTNAPATVTLNRTSDNLSSLGRTLSYTATVRNARGNAISDEPVAWNSTNTGVATVAATTAQSNVATAAGVGSTTIGATAGLASATATLSVTNDPATVILTPSPVTISSVGGSQVVTAVVRNDLGNPIAGVSLSWATSDVTVATVPGSPTVGSGTVNGAGTGSATVTVTAGAVSATVVVLVNDYPAAITIPALNQPMELGGVTGTFTPTNGAGQQVRITNGQGAFLPLGAVTWASSNAAVATVTSAGTVTATGAGTATITAVSPVDPGITGSYTVTVTAPPASVTIDQGAAMALSAVGRTLQYAATVRDAAGHVVAGVVTWTVTVGNGTIATINSGSGLATAAGTGAATIQASVASTLPGNPFTATSTLTVTNAPASVVASPSSVTITSVGATSSVTPTVYNDFGQAIGGATVTWSATPGGIVTVPGGSTSGAQNLTGAGAGVATVTITAAAGITTTVPVTVTNYPAAITIPALNQPMELGGASGTFTPTNGAGQQVRITNGQGAFLALTAVTWASSDAAVATVTSAGAVTATGAGTATITAASPVDPSITASYTVTVTAPPASATIDQGTATSLSAVGRTLQYTATVRDAAGHVLTGQSVTWSVTVGNGTIATINAGTGLATATGTGAATIQASVASTLPGAPFTATSSLTVTNDPASITVNPSNVMLVNAGDTLHLTAIVRNNIGVATSGSSVTWTTSNSAVVAFRPTAATSSNGPLITVDTVRVGGTGVGQATITASSGGVQATLLATVVNHPAPTLAAIAPTAGDRLQTLDVVFTGTGFVTGASTVSVGPDITVNTTTVNSPTQITANITISATAATGARNFSVANPAPGGGTSVNQTFTVNNPAATLTAIAPTSGDRLQTLDVVFTGTGFITGVSTVNVGPDITVNTTTVDNATQITANITVSTAAATGARNFSVTNAGPGGGTSGNQTFTVNNPAATLANIALATGDRLQTLDVVFTGTGFITGVSTVNVGPDITVNTTTVDNATQITANITISAAAATGARNFSVTNAGPGGGTSGNQTFTVNNPAPTLTNVNPASGVQGQANLDVALTGTNFITGASSVGFTAGDITINSTTVNSPTQITVNISIGAAATTTARDVSVTNAGPGGGTSGTQTFTVNAPAAPTLTSISPTAGDVLQTLDVVFTGTNFYSGVSTVDVGAGITVNSTTVNNPTQITANLTITAAAATGTRTFSVTNTPAGGTSGTQNFDVNNPTPTFTSITPATGSQGATSLDLTVIGTNFINGATVTFSGVGITVNTVTFVSATELTVNVDILLVAPLSLRDVTITNPAPTSGAGFVTAANAFEVVP